MAEHWRAERGKDGDLWTVYDEAGNVVFFGMDKERAMLIAAAPVGNRLSVLKHPEPPIGMQLGMIA